MPEFTVGDGVRSAMAARGDEPVAPSHFEHPFPGLTKEIGLGRDRGYIWDNFAGEPRLVLVEYNATPAPPDVVWKGSPNFVTGRLGRSPVAIVLHTAEGTLAGMDAWFAITASQVSAHFGVGLAGQVHQYVRLEDTAWANGVLSAGNRWPFGQSNPNPSTVSIETEDNKNPGLPVTEIQYEKVRALCLLIRTEYPTITHLVAHRAIDTGRSCPGPRWVESGKINQLAADLGLTLVV